MSYPIQALQLPYTGSAPNNTNQHSYREQPRSGSSESDSTPAKKVRKVLENFETPIFPLAPDFSEFREQEIEGYPLNLSLPSSTRNLSITEDFRGLDLTVCKASLDESSHVEVISSDSDNSEKKTTEPILETLWRSPRVSPVPDNSSQIKNSVKTEEDSNKVKCPSAATPHHKLDFRAPDSLIVAVLTAIPTMKTALTHFQYRYLEEQVDCE